MAITSVPLKLKCWLQYVGDAFAVWSLKSFQSHIYVVHLWIQFMMQMERDQELLFLDVLVHCRANGSLGYNAYRKPTHTDRYLHKISNHLPKQKRAVLKMLVDHVRRIYEPQFLDA